MGVELFNFNCSTWTTKRYLVSNILCLWKVIRGIIADKMDIKGGYAKPHWTDVLWVQLVILPLTVYRWTIHCSCLPTSLAQSHFIAWITYMSTLSGGQNSISFGCGDLVFWGRNMAEMSSFMSSGFYLQNFGKYEFNLWSGKTWESARDSLISWKRKRWRRCLSWSCGRRTTLLSGKRKRRQKSGSRWLRVAGEIISMCEMVSMREIVFMHEICFMPSSGLTLFCRYKQYRRYMKNHGADRMTFED